MTFVLKQSKIVKHVIEKNNEVDDIFFYEF